MRESDTCPICRQRVDGDIIHLYNSKDEVHTTVGNLLQELRVELSKSRNNELNELKAKITQLVFDKHAVEGSLRAQTHVSEVNEKALREVFKMHNHSIHENSKLKELITSQQQLNSLYSFKALQQLREEHKSNKETLDDLSLTQKRLVHDLQLLNTNISKTILSQNQGNFESRENCFFCECWVTVVIFFTILHLVHKLQFFFNVILTLFALVHALSKLKLYISRLIMA